MCSTVRIENRRRGIVAESNRPALMGIRGDPHLLLVAAARIACPSQHGSWRASSADRALPDCWGANRPRCCPTHRPDAIRRVRQVLAHHPPVDASRGGRSKCPLGNDVVTPPRIIAACSLPIGCRFPIGKGKGRIPTAGIKVVDHQRLLKVGRVRSPRINGDENRIVVNHVMPADES